MGHYHNAKNWESVSEHVGIIKKDEVNFTHKPAQKYFQKCEYCDSWYDKCLTKYPNCGARAKEM